MTVRIHMWTCNACGGETACELVTEDPEAVPRECPLHHLAKWEGEA